MYEKGLAVRKLWLTTAIILALAPAAAAETGQLADFSLRLGSQQPATASALDLRVVFHTAGDPDVKSSPIRSVVISTPAGTSIDNDAMPKCEASDEELRASGADACPADTQAGFGSYSAILGFGPPVDPFVGDNHVFNADHQLIEVITVSGGSASPGFDRLTVKDGTLTAHPPVTPGGPPDGETATRSIEFALPVHRSGDRALITTPPDCPASGTWESSGTFGFADGTAETIVSRTPCIQPANPPHCDAGRLRMRVPRPRTARVRRAVLLVDGVVVRRLRSRQRRVFVDLTNRSAGRHRVTIRVVTRDGQRLRRSRTVLTCGARR